MIRHGDIDFERLDNRPQQAFGLTQRLVEHRPLRETCFNSEHRINRLTTALSGRSGMPCHHSFLDEPNREPRPDAPARGSIAASSSPDIWLSVSCGGGSR
jgi:hypothetical protein